MLAAEHGTDIVETILRIQRKTNDDHLWSDVIVRNRLTARAEIGIATFQPTSFPGSFVFPQEGSGRRKWSGSSTTPSCGKTKDPGNEVAFQHVDAKIQWFILPTGHSNRVPKLHGNLQQKGAFGESVHEAKETILVNDHVT